MTNTEWTSQQTDLLERYFALLTEWNKKFNLTAVDERQDVWNKHFADSAAGAQFLPQNASVCDVGSGAGFPGVILKILRPDIRLTLMDSVGKKVKFLQELTTQLGIEADCRQMRAEDAAATDMRESFDVVTARAVARLNVLLEYCLPLVKTDGWFLAYKADAAAEESNESKRALQVLSAKIERIYPYKLDSGDNRQLIIVKKTGKTPRTYPRAAGKPRKSPL